MQKIFYKEVSSTMDEARKEADYLNANEHLMLVADKQSNGRGQKGRKWASEAGGIYFTIASSINSSFDLSGYSLFVGILINKTLSEFNVETKLKWPNDIFDTDGRKIAGVLIETYKNKEQQILLTGIGINLSNTPDVDIEANSISNLSERKLRRIDILSAFEKYFESDINIFLEKSFSEYNYAWNELNYFRNKNITFDNGEKKLNGISIGVDKKGRILIQNNNEKYSFVSGNITF